MDYWVIWNDKSEGYNLASFDSLETANDFINGLENDDNVLTFR